MTKVPLRGQKSVRNQSEAGPAQPLSLSLPCLFAHTLTRTPTPTPTPISTTTGATATPTASAAGTTVSFPDRFRTAQAYFAPKFEIECVHAWILALITRLATTLSTTTTPAATAPPLPLVHLGGISAFAFKSNWHESRWRVRNQSETNQKPLRNRPNATISSPPSLPLSLSFSLSLPLPFFPCPATRTPTPIPTPIPTPTPTPTIITTTTPATTTTATTATATTTATTATTTTYYYYYILLLLLLLLLLLVLLWVFRTVSGPRNFLFFSNMKTNAFMRGSFY